MKNFKYTIFLILILGSCYQQGLENFEIENKKQDEDVLAVKLNSKIVEIQQMYLGSNEKPSKGFKVNESRYILKIKIERFDDNIPYPEGLYFKGIQLKDDGTENDLIAGDGVYTSKESLSIIEWIFRSMLTPPKRNVFDIRMLPEWLDSTDIPADVDPLGLRFRRILTPLNNGFGFLADIFSHR
jgi:hypothetical protein